MSSMIYLTLLALFAGLFVLAWLARRRFGVLGMALAAGAILSQNLADSLVNLLLSSGAPPLFLSLNLRLLVPSLLILLPSLLLMLAGPKYFGRLTALVGAAGYAALGSLLLLGPVGDAVSGIQPLGAPSFLDAISRYRTSLVALLIVLAVIDAFGIHAAKPAGKHRPH
ncbi:MAG: hypothetical protein EOT04_00620 [Candidatus Chaera renei]|uniref:Uncharacterized protein n=1 Tax=Candidatus Chaera renei TaxID=2506947 RepID=A0A4Q0AJL7_9BACT|nr:MAG: hypothetical protein EOT04_00620 [Candidatus Chaera renei]